MIDLNVTLLVQLACFLLLMFLLNTILFRPVLKVLEERKSRTQGRREEAADMESRAESAWEDYQTRLSDAKSDADQVRTALVKEGEAERQRMTDAAQAEADKIIAETRTSIRGDYEEARKSLLAEVELMGREMAGKILGRAV